MRRVRLGLRGPAPWLIAWGLLVASSQLYLASRSAETDQGRSTPPRRLEIPAMSDDGPVAGRTMQLAIRAWPSEGEPAATNGMLPVVMAHGSPGSASNFSRLGNSLAATGRDSYAPDLPGFGSSDAWVPSYSIEAHAHALLAMMDVLEIERAHLISWSMGGGVILHAAELAPERVASLTQIAAIGVQEAEGTGSFHFEHFKYAVNYLLMVVVPELVPHFGALGPRQFRHAFARNFWDTDQRPLRGIMERLRTPVLILQGRHDFLVPLWAAEASHELLPNSRLAIFEGSHFLPFPEPSGQLEESMGELVPFLAASEQGRLTDIAFERVDTSLPQASGLVPFWLQRKVPWWALFALIVSAWWFFSEATVLTCGVLMGTLQLDPGFALITCAVVLTVHDGAHRGGARAGRTFLRWLAGIGWSLALTILGAAFGASLVARLATIGVPGWAAVPMVALALYLPVVLVRRLLVRRGWRGPFPGRGRSLKLTSSRAPRPAPR